MRAGIALSLSAFILAALVTAQAGLAAAGNDRPAYKPGEPVGIISLDTTGKLNAMTPAQRDAAIKSQAEKLRKMTPKKRQAYFAENRRKFDALPPEKKKEIQERLKKASADYIAAHKAEWDKNAAEEKKLEDKRTKEFVAQIPGIERAVLQKYKELRKTHSKDYAWHAILEDARSGGKIAPLPEGQ